MEHLSGRIFINELHGSTFFDTQKDGFYALQLFSDEVLRAAEITEFEAETGTNMVIIPITGDLIYKDNLEEDDLEVNVGQALLICCPASFNFMISNPFDEHEINFLVLKLTNSQPGTQLSISIFEFELATACNRFIDIISHDKTAEIKELFPFRMSIGKFCGREETKYLLNNSGLFCYVLSGAFEIQGRLLHARDGLALWNIDEMELEALSNDAVVLAIEIPYI